MAVFGRLSVTNAGCLAENLTDRQSAGAQHGAAVGFAACRGARLHLRSGNRILVPPQPSPTLIEDAAHDSRRPDDPLERLRSERDDGPARRGGDEARRGGAGAHRSRGAAASVGLTLRPTEALVFGNPRAGTPLMQAVQTMGIDLPLRALVWRDEAGATWLGYNDPAWLARRHGAEVGHEPPSPRNDRFPRGGGAGGDEALRGRRLSPQLVIPANAGIQRSSRAATAEGLDPRLRGDDGAGSAPRPQSSGSAMKRTSPAPLATSSRADFLPAAFSVGDRLGDVVGRLDRLLIDLLDHLADAQALVACRRAGRDGRRPPRP